MFRKNIEVMNKIRTNLLKEGKDAKLLAKGSDYYAYELNEYICILEKVVDRGIDQNTRKKRADELTLRFADGKVITSLGFANEYTGKSIPEKTLISVMGYYTGNSFSCVGGLNPIYTNLSEIGRLNTSYVYRMGIYPQLSSLKEAERYWILGKDDSIKKLENVSGDFYYKEIDLITTNNNLNNNLTPNQYINASELPSEDIEDIEEDYTTIMEEIEDKTPPTEDINQ